MTYQKPFVKHVTILGRAEVYAPLPPGEVWGVNGLPRTSKEWDRLTRQFQLHPFRWLDRSERTALKWVKDLTYTILPMRRFPHTRAYPRTLIRGGPFASSFDYMMALAIYEGFTSILLTGIDYQHGSLRERLCEHVSLAYWVGRARGKGIQVTISPKSTLLKFPWRYGYDYVQERRWGQQQGRSALMEGQLDDGQARRRRVKGIVSSGRLLGKQRVVLRRRLRRLAKQYDENLTVVRFPND